ncbi:hypothetical protein [Maribacter sp.]|uniref:Uncharacterized protein n=1 Tax=marine sediment metagenome TaxID=412755 RepID=A0A0F9XPJ1_9ZZZZ|nr:hypothetical protein [Maribacter sp.]HDZ07433.1 hypothetical protein [Maribacter sp.]HEA79874.1 hypothetical protein [Maribacter sp.]|tara:strand:- start:1017 stop:1304 length:288 start_codon:yes stop_codon:yes gene_type:complete
MICHIINNTFVDELIDVIENDTPEVNLKYVVSSSLSESHFVPKTMHGSSGQSFYEFSNSGKNSRTHGKNMARFNFIKNNRIRIFVSLFYQSLNKG